MGVGILGAVVLGTISVAEIGLKGQASVEQGYAVGNLHRGIYSLLEVTGICSYNFGIGPNQKNVNLATGTATISLPAGLKDATGAQLYGIYDTATLLPTYEAGNIRITSLTLENFKFLAGTEGQMDLAIQIEKNKNSFGATAYRKRIIRIKVNLTGPYDSTLATPNNIGTCIAVGGAADQIWSQNMDATIYYNGGNVGVGTVSPTAKLSIIDGSATTAIRGETALLAGYGAEFYNTNSGTSSYVKLAGAQGSNVNSVFMGGNVGIGTTAPVAKLDVAGGIRIGNDASLCDAANPNTQGTQRFNATSTPKQMEFCNGTTWGPIGSGGGGGKDATIGVDTIASGGVVDLVSVSCQGSGSPILLTFQTIANSGTITGAMTATYVVYRNAVAIYTTPRPFYIASGGTQTPHAFMYKDIVAITGNNLYRIQVFTTPNVVFETPQLKCESL